MDFYVQQYTLFHTAKKNETKANFSLMSLSSHFHFFILVDDKVTKDENRLCDFLYSAFRLQGKTGKPKSKIIKNNKL